MMQALSLRLLANWSFAQDSFNTEIEAKTKQVIDKGEASTRRPRK